MKKIISLFALSCILVTFNQIAYSCDLCALYNSIELQKLSEGTFRFSIAQQQTGFDKVQFQGKYVDNVGHQHMQSSNTQFVGTYDLSDHFGVQLNLPYISRSFKRVENGEAQTGAEAGLGDMSLLARIVPYRYKGCDTAVNLQFFAGVKIPTGDSGRLKEELEEEQMHTDHVSQHSQSLILKHDDEEQEEHEEIPSAFHGHDLALGSGSYDFPVGASIFAQADKFLLLGNLQYVFRTKGDHFYEYADDLTYSAGPGYLLALSHSYTIATGVNLSGEYKGKDKGKGGEIQGDTGVRSMFVGPQVMVTSGESLSGQLGFDLPLNVNNTGFQAVPTYRLRAGITYRF